MLLSARLWECTLVGHAMHAQVSASLLLCVLCPASAFIVHRQRDTLCLRRCHCCCLPPRLLLLQPPPELAAVLSQLQARQPRLLADTAAMAGALEALTVTPREAWAGLLGELGLEVDRKLLALQVGGLNGLEI